MDRRSRHRDDDPAAALERGSRAARAQLSRGRILQPQAKRALTWALAVLAVLGAAAGVWWYVGGRDDGSVSLATAPKNTEPQVTFAGVFPPLSDPALKNPLGIAVIGDRVFVSESDAGVIREFAADGGRRGSIALPRAPGAAAVYPADLAAVDADTLAVIDTASSRVLLVSTTSGAAPLVLGATDAKTAPGQPTAVARLADGIAVADGRDHLVKVYDAEGRFLRKLDSSRGPRLGFVGGMALAGGRLQIADSSAGRVVSVDLSSGAQSGTFADRIQLARGVASAGESSVLVVSTFGRSLSLYDGSDGRRLAILGEDTTGLPDGARLVLPKGVAWMAATSRAYVADAGDGRIRVFNVITGAGK